MSLTKDYSLLLVAGISVVAALFLILSLGTATAWAQTNPSVTAPGNVTPGSSVTPAPNVTPPSVYLGNLYLWFLGFVGIAAVFALVTGGLLYMFSGPNITKTEQARKWITNAIYGVILAAVSVLLLRTINPDLVGGFDLETIVQSVLPPAPSPSPSP